MTETLGGGVYEEQVGHQRCVFEAYWNPNRFLSFSFLTAVRQRAPCHGLSTLWYFASRQGER